MSQTSTTSCRSSRRKPAGRVPAAIARAEALKAPYKLATELILLRKRHGLTQRQLSARTGIQQSEISRIEGGRARPAASSRRGPWARRAASGATQKL